MYGAREAGFPLLRLDRQRAVDPHLGYEEKGPQRTEPWLALTL